MFNRHALSAFVPTTVFVLLWSSGAIVSKIGLAHGSPFALLIVRYALALAALALVATLNGRFLPSRGSRGRVIFTGLTIAGLYSACYLLALDHGMTPGVLATLLGIQPILTLALTERNFGLARVSGLLLAFVGLGLVVWDGVAAAQLSLTGLLFASLSLLGITFGSIAQKRETQAPWIVLPMQYAAGLGLTGLALPFVPFEAAWDSEFVLSALWLGLGISVGATFLLYRLIARGNLVNVTSLFYLVPGVTAVLDWLVLGNLMSGRAIAGLAIVVAGLVLTFRQKSI